MLRTLILPAALLVLVACGTTTGERALSGAGIGGAAGAVTGALSGGSVVESGLIGAALGAAAGALTDEEQINLGEPVWKR